MVVAMASSLFDLDERAGKILRMQEQHRFAMRSGLRLAVPKYPGAFPDQPVARRENVGHIVADMMDAAVGIALEEFCDRRGLPKRLDKFYLGIRQRHEHGEDTVLRQRHRR